MYGGLDTDLIIIDRYWSPHKISLDIAKDIVNEIRIAGARFIYALDDNFFDIPSDRSNSPTREQLTAVKYFLRTADMVWVTTPYLQKSFENFNEKIKILPNSLDERLLIRRAPKIAGTPFDSKKKVIGYMGTMTHDDDLLMILPALQAVCGRHPEVEIEIIGGASCSKTYQQLQDLPVRFLKPARGEDIYPNFMLWFTNWINWDIGIAPLMDTDFNRAKSDIKFLDYAAIGAPGVFSDVLAFQKSVHHQGNGWLVSNKASSWEEALEFLLEDDGHRINLAKEAQDTVFSSRILKYCATNWLEALWELDSNG